MTKSTLSLKKKDSMLRKKHFKKWKYPSKKLLNTPTIYDSPEYQEAAREWAAEER